MLNHRPTTAGLSSNKQWPPQQAVNSQKQILGGSSQAIDLEALRLRPKVVNQERESLYEDVLKQKLQGNLLKDENTKLRTRVQMLEVELMKNQRLVDELLIKPESVASNGSGA